MQVEEITLGNKVLLNVYEIPYWAGNCAVPHELTLYNDRAVTQWVKFRKKQGLWEICIRSYCTYRSNVYFS